MENVINFSDTSFDSPPATANMNNIYSIKIDARF